MAAYAVQKGRESMSSPAPQKERIPPDHVGVLIAAALMTVVGLVGLYLLVTTQVPRIGGQLWLFFVLLHLAVTGIALPFVRYLNLRFTPITRRLAPGGVLVRQSVWVGLYVVTCAWLRIPRVLTLPIAILLALVFIGIEAFLRSRERAIED